MEGFSSYSRPSSFPVLLTLPDIDYAKAAEAFGVEAEGVKEPDKLKGALDRAQRAVADGRPYLLDVNTYRDGMGAVSTWYPAYSIADLRKRRV